MSKKKFSEGLDDLFKDLPAEDVSWTSSSESTARERKPGGKNFMQDLDVMLQEALDEQMGSADTGQSPTATPSSKSKSAAAHRAPMSGLDALIRQTIDVREITADEESGKKRLTVAVDKTKLEKLKTIARLENAYMKDILVRLIDEYIREYRQQNGLDL